MALQSKAIKISDRAYSLIRKELGFRVNSDNDRIKLKEVASDLIIAGFEQKQDNPSIEELTVQYILSIKKWKSDFDESTIEMVAHIIFWEHVKLALSKGYNSEQAMDHVHQFLTNKKNKSNLIGIVGNYLNSIKEIL